MVKRDMVSCFGQVAKTWTIIEVVEQAFNMAITNLVVRPGHLRATRSLTTHEEDKFSQRWDKLKIRVNAGTALLRQLGACLPGVPASLPIMAGLEAATEPLQDQNALAATAILRPGFHRPWANKAVSSISQA
jgi:hypothetical protein